MNWIPWLIIIALCWALVDNPLQPKAWRQWRKARRTAHRQKEQAKRTRKGPARYWLEFIGSMVLFLFFFRAMVVEAYRIPSGSMERTLLVGDFLLVNKFLYGMRTPDWVGIPFTRFGFDVPYLELPPLRDPRPGDIMVFRYPKDPLTNYIKRMVAGPGQTVQVRDKHALVDGVEFPPMPGQVFAMRQVLPPDFHDVYIWPLGSGWNKDQWGPALVPARDMTIELTPEHWRLYREAIEQEGRRLSTTPEGGFLVDGRPATSYTFSQNHYFMMGDNRDRSADSRYWGFVPEENVVGKAWIIYFSFDAEKVKDEFWQVIRFGRLLRFIE
ncbi:MAG: signal peptidase I [bacterium]|nr:signal peptidase I [bacterium]